MSPILLECSLLLLAGAVLASAGHQGAYYVPVAKAPEPGKAPGMRVELLTKQGEEPRQYAVIFGKGDEVASGLVEFAQRYQVTSAHFTGIGAISSATTAWLNLDKKMYRPTVTTEQVEVLSLVGDIAAYNGKPVVHMHAVLGHRDGTTTGGHVWELNVNPTLEIFLTANTTPLAKRPDPASGLKLIDPIH